MCSWGLSEWGDVANIVIAVASVATAIVTAIVLVKQYKAATMEHQPTFNIGIRANPIGVTIECNQGRFLNIKLVKATRYMRIFEQNLSDSAQYDFYYPIKYYGKVYVNGNFNGVVATIDSHKCPIYQYHKLCNTITSEIQAQHQTTRVYIFERDIFHIQYIDSFGHGKDYFIDGHQYISKQEYQKLMRQIIWADIPPLDISVCQPEDILSAYYKHRTKIKIK